MIKRITIFFMMYAMGMSIKAESEIKIRGGAAIPTGDRFKAIYGNVTGTVQVELATKLYKCMEGWININWLDKKGYSIGLCSLTEGSILNGAIGLKFGHYFAECWKVYAGVGPSFGRIKLKNSLPQCCEKVSKGVVGVVFKSGLYYWLTDRIFIDLFADYLYQRAGFESKVSIGGFKIGAGLGFGF